jgi:hypothetical protein
MDNEQQNEGRPLGMPWIAEYAYLPTFDWDILQDHNLVTACMRKAKQLLSVGITQRAHQ